jgi:hypothetical protein
VYYESPSIQHSLSNHYSRDKSSHYTSNGVLYNRVDCWSGHTDIVFTKCIFQSVSNWRLADSENVTEKFSQHEVAVTAVTADSTSLPRLRPFVSELNMSPRRHRNKNHNQTRSLADNLRQDLMFARHAYSLPAASTKSSSLSDTHMQRERSLVTLGSHYEEEGDSVTAIATTSQPVFVSTSNASVSVAPDSSVFLTHYEHREGRRHEQPIRQTRSKAQLETLNRNRLTQGQNQGDSGFFPRTRPIPVPLTQTSLAEHDQKFNNSDVHVTNRYTPMGGSVVHSYINNTLTTSSAKPGEVVPMARSQKAPRSRAIYRPLQPKAAFVETSSDYNHTVHSKEVNLN